VTRHPERRRPQKAPFRLGFDQDGSGAAVLDGLGLRDGANINPSKSPYAELVRRLLASKPEGHVVNRNELIATKDGVEAEPTTGLEPEWLRWSCWHWPIAVRSRSRRARRQSMRRTCPPAHAPAQSARPLQDHSATQGDAIASLKVLFEMLELNPSLLDSMRTARRQACRLPCSRKSTGRFGNWPHSQCPARRRSVVATTPGADHPNRDYKDFLDRLTSLNTGGKLRQYKTSSEALDSSAAARAALRDVAARLVRLEELEGLDDYRAMRRQP